MVAKLLDGKTSTDTITVKSGTFWGTAYDEVDTHFTPAGFNDVTSYLLNGAVVAKQVNNPSGGFTVTTYASGVWSLVFTQNADGSYDGRHNTAGTFWGVSYASYDRAVSSSGKVLGDTYYDANGAVVGTKTFAAGGAYTVDLYDSLGRPTLVYVENANGSHSEQHWLPGTFWGIGYASVTWKDTATNFNYENDYFDTSGHEVASDVLKTDGSFVVTTYDSNNKPTLIFTQNADGSYDGEHFTSGTINGVTYAAFDRAFDSKGVFFAESWYGADNNLLLKETFSPTGKITSIDTYANGGHDLWSATGGTFWGLSYSSRDTFYDSKGFNYDIKFLDASGKLLADKTNFSDGGWEVQLYPSAVSSPTSTFIQNAGVGAGYETIKPITNSQIADQQTAFYSGTGTLETLVSTKNGVAARVDNYDSTGKQVSSQLLSANDPSAPLGKTNQIDFFALDKASTTLAFKEDASNSFATLTLKQGDESLSLVLLGQYSAGQFGLAADGHGGSLLTYTAQTNPTLAASH
ncbi:hypothetical protein CCR94_01555 [Rhodoblastus sphagnicola]|uniref:Uncharacterized protein n=1 Tax=Rhodoblastus sphagnicola TaxID=333368 RepID=A0A2S6NG29_9HYPH|nr:hypothetical protein [Rhodoblastus sphagnicola]MBB4199470.1 hypothetical protein [Rhodoblastus sphagnicola]PPQ33561.1 hypothetical protein CCR94_01555 [Rhodoblastus sphagnicola]